MTIVKTFRVTPSNVIWLIVLVGLGIRLFLTLNHEGYLGVDGGA